MSDSSFFRCKIPSVTYGFLIKICKITVPEIILLFLEQNSPISHVILRVEAFVDLEPIGSFVAMGFTAFNA